MAPRDPTQENPTLEERQDLDSMLKRIQDRMGERFAGAFASARVQLPSGPTKTSTQGTAAVQLVYIGPGSGGRSGLFTVTHPSAADAVPSLRPVLCQFSGFGVQEKLAVLEVIPDLIDSLVLNSLVPSNLQEIYVLEDGETWSSVPPTPVRVTKEQLDRIEGGTKVRDVLPDPRWRDGFPAL